MNCVQPAPTGNGFRSTSRPGNRKPLAAVTNFSLAYHWVFLAAAMLLALWGASLLAVRLWTRQQVIKDLLRQEGDPDEAMITLPDSRAEDRAALAVIRSYRRHYLLKWLPGTAISFKAINDMSLEMIKEIARVYYPDEDRPELKASLPAWWRSTTGWAPGWPPGSIPCPCGPLRMWSWGRWCAITRCIKASKTIGAMPSSSATTWTKRCGGVGPPLIMTIPGTGAARRPTTAARRWRPGSSWPGLPTWWARRRCAAHGRRQPPAVKRQARARLGGPGHRVLRESTLRAPRKDNLLCCVSRKSLRRN